MSLLLSQTRRRLLLIHGNCSDLLAFLLAIFVALCQISFVDQASFRSLGVTRVLLFSKPRSTSKKKRPLFRVPPLGVHVFGIDPL